MLIHLLEEVEKTGGMDYIQVFLRYFWYIQEEVSPETLAQAIEEYADSQHLGEQAMSIAEKGSNLFSLYPRFKCCKKGFKSFSWAQKGMGVD